MVVKRSHETAAHVGEFKIRQVGPSLGSFSMSATMLAALCREFSVELAKKHGPSWIRSAFWMPLTLSEQDYVTLMKQRVRRLNRPSITAFPRMIATKAFDMGIWGLFEPSMLVGTRAGGIIVC
jgi:hypothetical protein